MIAIRNADCFGFGAGEVEGTGCEPELVRGRDPRHLAKITPQEGHSPTPSATAA